MAKILDQYENLAPPGDLERIRKLAPRLKGLTVQHIYSSSLEGGFVNMLQRSAPLYHDLGLRPRWNLMLGTEEFFEICRQLQRGLIGQAATITPAMIAGFSEGAKWNARNLYLSADVVVTHDLPPMGLVEWRSRRTPWVWRCHFDLSRALWEPWAMLRGLIPKYDAVIFSHAKFTRRIPVERVLIRPAIDPFSERNRELSTQTVRETALRLGVDAEVPIILQVANFDQTREWPGLLRLFRRLRREMDCALVLARTAAESRRGDEPYFEQVRELAGREEDVHLVDLPPGAFHEVNALEQAAAIVLQPTTHQGFDLIVLEALWNRKPVIVGAASGRLLGLAHGQTAYLMSSLSEAYAYLRGLLSDPALRNRLAENGREYVRKHYLITRVVGEYLELLLKLK